MSEANTAPPQASAAQPEASNNDRQAVDRLRRWTLIILAACCVFFIWYLVADRFTPMTSQARVRGFVIPIAPQVAGVVKRVSVINNQVVQKGEVLLEIDSSDYQLVVASAEADLEKAGQDLGASTASVSSAQAQLVDAQANEVRIATDAERMFALEKQGVVSRSDGDMARAELKRAKAQVASAQAELARAKEQLGASGADNPRIRAALSALEDARLDLSRTTIVAPTIGGVVNVKIAAGFYATTGQPLMTFISGEDVWIEAYMRENSIGNVQQGDRVEIILDSAPGRVYKGEVASIAYGVKTEKGSTLGDLAQVTGSTGWLREPQRFPVIIRFTDKSAAGLRREGGQADVIVYTGDNFVLNGLGWVWARVMSIFSYIY